MHNSAHSVPQDPVTIPLTDVLYDLFTEVMLLKSRVQLLSDTLCYYDAVEDKRHIFTGTDTKMALPGICIQEKIHNIKHEVISTSAYLYSLVTVLQQALGNEKIIKEDLL